MLTRLAPWMAVAVLLGLLCGRVDPARETAAAAPENAAREPSLSERVLFSAAPAGTAARRAPLPAREMKQWLPDPGAFGFDDVVLEEKTIAEAVPAPVGLPLALLAVTPALFTRDEARPESPRSSETAYASFASPAPRDSGGIRADIPSGDLPPLMLEALAAPDSARPLSRGLRVRADGGLLRAEQELSLFDNAAYRLSGRKYSVGLDYDWSVDTVVGAGVEMLDATVKSGQPYDSRKTTVSGLFANASLDTVLFNSYLVGVKGFYGTLDSGSSGAVGAWDDRGATSARWREAEHDSRMYGLSGKVSVPVLLRGQRVVFDAGVEYARIDTGGHEYELADAGAARTERLSSTSLAFPVNFSVERDFLTRRALVTPRFSAGYSYETSDSAGGVRAMNALSALPLPYHSAGFHSAPPPFVSLQKTYHAGLGLDVKTTGGWDMALDYRRDFADAYSQDSLSLELGRSF